MRLVKPWQEIKLNLIPCEGRSMANLFEIDPNPGQPRILFIGLASSSHNHSWVDLLESSKFNMRLFSTPYGVPPSYWNVRTYITEPHWGQNNNIRRYLYRKNLPGKIKFYLDSFNKHLFTDIGLGFNSRPEVWLSQIIKEWRPDIIHTLGLFDGQGGIFYYNMRRQYHLEGIGKWVLQLRGGSDLTLRRHNPEFIETIRNVLMECDQILSDNYLNIKYAIEMGIPSGKFAKIVPVPGTGGVDIDNICANGYLPPSQRQRLILWPKAYESQWSKALPVLEAIKTVWDDIQPCEIYILYIASEVREWYLSLPERIRQNCHVSERVPREQVLSLMKRARVMLAPSLIDGVPNILYEAMAFGAFPIISPLETILPLVKENENVLFARNLYPDEIAKALICAMKDDVLIDKAAVSNFKIVESVANKQTIKTQVVNFYTDLLKFA
jgi:glycosyltransferase involved in cell wall biosynthesis